LAVIIEEIESKNFLFLSVIAPSNNGSDVVSRLVISIVLRSLTSGTNCCLVSTGLPVRASGTETVSSVVAETTARKTSLPTNSIPSLEKSTVANVSGSSSTLGMTTPCP